MGFTTFGNTLFGYCSGFVRVLLHQCAVLWGLRGARVGERWNNDGTNPAIAVTSRQNPSKPFITVKGSDGVVVNQLFSGVLVDHAQSTKQ